MGEWFWLLFVVVAMQPVLRQKLLEASRNRLIKSLQDARGSRVIALVHRQETMSFLGIPVFRYIDIDDSERLLRAIQTTDDDVPIDLVLHTPGGLVLAATQIARALVRHPAKVTVFVPHYAMSGGTLIALAADEIAMSEHAVLGPVDPQIGKFPAASLLRAVEQKPAADVDDETLILADQAKMAIAQLREVVTEILCNRLEVEQCEELATRLSEGRWTHDFPITPEHARKLGLPVTDTVPPQVLQLMELYPQPMRRQPGVEYLPAPRRRRPAPPPQNQD